MLRIPLDKRQVIPPITDEEVLRSSKLGSADRSLLKIYDEEKRIKYHDAFNQGIKQVQTILKQIADKVGLAYDKVEADMFCAITMPKHKRGVRAWEVWVTKELERRNKGKSTDSQC
jgi:hypothetical protein